MKLMNNIHNDAHRRLEATIDSYISKVESRSKEKQDKYEVLLAWAKKMSKKTGALLPRL